LISLIEYKVYFIIVTIFFCLGEWWKSDTEAIINEALKSGLAPNISDAHTINGLPGPGQGCASQGDFQ
jgi:laccase